MLRDSLPPMEGMLGSGVWSAENPLGERADKDGRDDHADGSPEARDEVRLCMVGPEPGDQREDQRQAGGQGGELVEHEGEVRFHDVTMSVSAGEAPVLPDDVRARFARTDFILDMYESGVYDREEAGEKLFDHLFGKGRTVMDSGD